MSVNLPIRKGEGRFNLQFSIPDRVKQTIESQKALGDLQFLQLLSDDARLIFEQGSITGAGTIVSVTPDTGTTFFYLGAVVQNVEPTGGTDGIFSLRNNGSTREAVTLIVGADPYQFNIPFDRLVGNMSDTFTITASTADVDAEASLYGFVINTENIQ